MESDPNVVPSIPADDVADYRSRFAGAHPEIVLLRCTEVRKKFVVRLDRDFTINSIIHCYSLGETRRGTEEIASKQRVVPSADQLMKLVRYQFCAPRPPRKRRSSRGSTHSL